MDFAALDRMSTGQLVARASSDTTLVQGLLMFIPMMSGNLLLMVLSLGVMLVLSPPLALVSLIIAPALMLVSYRMRTKIFPATWDAQQREGEVIQIVDEAVNGVRVVKAFGQERRELERVTDVLRGALRLADAGGAADLALPAAAAGDPRLRPGRDPRLRRLARAARQDQPRHLPRLHHLRRPARLADPPARRPARDRAAGAGRGRADLPAARPGPRRSPTRPTRSSWGRSPATSTSTTSASATTSAAASSTASTSM